MIHLFYLVILLIVIVLIQNLYLKPGLYIGVILFEILLFMYYLFILLKFSDNAYYYYKILLEFNYSKNKFSEY